MSLQEVIGLTLLYSLWQGLLFYCLLRVFLPFLRRSAARYYLAYGTLIALAAFVWATGWSMWQGAGEPALALEATGERTQAILQATLVTLPGEAGRDWLTGLAALLPLLSTAYLIGLSVTCFYLLVQHLKLYRLRSSGLADVPIAWRESFARTIDTYYLRQPVTVKISERAGTVLTFGWWRPMVLFPVACVNQLTIEEARLVLLHELAHLRHYDHLLIYPQQFIRAVLFYHPAVHLICRTIDREREHRCDDWVVERIQDRTEYANALVSVARGSAGRPTPLSLSITQTPFARRIHRLFREPTSIQRYREAGASFIFLGCFFLLVLLPFMESWWSAEPIQEETLQETKLGGAAGFPEAVPIASSIAIDTPMNWAVNSMVDSFQPITRRMNLDRLEFGAEPQLDFTIRIHNPQKEIEKDRGILREIVPQSLNRYPMPVAPTITKKAPEALPVLPIWPDTFPSGLDPEVLRKYEVTKERYESRRAEPFDGELQHLEQLRERANQGIQWKTEALPRRDAIGADLLQVPSIGDRLDAAINDSIAIFLDGKQILSRPIEAIVQPSEIEHINVIKNRESLEERGLQISVGAIYIYAKKVKKRD